MNGKENWKSSYCHNPILTLFRWLMVAEKAGIILLSSYLFVMCDAMVLALSFWAFE